MILVIGADGLIGGALFHHLKTNGYPVLGTSRRPETPYLHFDLRNPRIFNAPKNIQTTVLCAGTGGVTGCAQDPENTFAINVTGSTEIARKMAAAGSQVIFLSTNLVFDGQQGPSSVDAPTTPCCEYGRQKALLESGLKGKEFACVRITKIMETLGSRFSAWRRDLQQGREVKASSVLKFSPVGLGEVVHALSKISNSFAPGTFHISGDTEYTYHEAAIRLTKSHGFSEALVQADAVSGLQDFFRVPRSSMLRPAPLPGSSDWMFSRSSTILDNFIRSL